MKDEQNARVHTVLASQHLKEEKYWLERLTGDWEVCCFPPDRRMDPALKQWDECPFELELDLMEPLMKLRNGSDPRLHMILEASLAVLLHFYTSIDDIIVAMPALRQDFEADFVNTVMPIRHQISGSATFKEILLAVRQSVVQAIENQNYPVDMIPHLLGRESPGSESPLFDVAVLLDNIHDPRYLEAVPLNMIFSFSRKDERVGGTARFNCSRYSPEAIGRVISHFQRVLAAAVTQPEAQIGSIDILSAAECYTLLNDFNGESRQLPEAWTIQGLCRRQARRTPDAIALKGRCLEDGGRHTLHVTFAELDLRAARLASILRERGAAAKTVIVLCIDRSVDMIAAILGVLYTGSAYLPIDPSNPAENVRYILRDSGTKLAVSGGIDLRSNGDVLMLDIRECDLGGELDCLEISDADAHDPAYVIYTSGTTGRPKGVLVEHRGAVNALECRRLEYRLDGTDVSLQLFASSFDGFITSFFTPFISGARTILPSANEVADISYIRKTVQRERVTCMISVPSFFQAMIENLSPAESSSLRVATLAGDRIPVGLPALAHQKNPGLELANEYGVTELSVMSTIARGVRPGNEPVIGKPVWNTRIYIVNGEMRLQPVGVPGELVVGGTGVARGYVNKPSLTAERFVTNPFESGDVCYRTGDRGRWLEDGSIEYLGRIDQQIKIRGYRIEPAEIEQCIAGFPMVLEAAVTDRSNDRGDRMLVAFVVPAPEQSLDHRELRHYLAERLPEHMIPAHFVDLEAIPLTAVGKIDRRALARIPLDLSLQRRTIAPRNDTERTLAGIWSRMLGVEEVSVADNFFTIGGDSIKTIGLLNAVSETFGVKLEILDLYENETVEKLARLVDNGETASTGHRDADDVRRVVDELKERIIAAHGLADVEDIYPISDIQTGLIFYGMKNTAAAQYHIQFVYPVITDDFDPGLLKQALILLTRKHAMLRTSFNLADYDEPVQLVHRDAVLDLEDLDITGMPVKQQEDYVRKVLLADRDTPFDIGSLPLWRMKSIRLAPGRICLVSTLHHVIGDGWGSANFMTELNNTYLELKINPGFLPEPLESDYKEFVIQQLQEKQKPGTAEFWRRELDDYKRLDFFASGKDGDRPSDMQSFQYQLGKELLAKIKEKALALDTNIKHLSFAAYNFVIKMLSYEQDIVVGLLTNNRPATKDGDKIFGCFLNTVPVRMPIGRNLSWQDYVRQTDRKMMELKKYDRLSLFEIARVVGEKAQDGNPFFDTLFNFVDFHVYQTMDIDPAQRKATQREPGVDPYREFYVPGRQDTNTFFDFEVNTTAGEFMICVKYNQAAISEIIAHRCCHYFEEFLLQVLNHPKAAMAKNALFPEEERRLIIERFNDTDAPFDDCKTMHRLFEEQAERTPGATAVEAADRTVSYRELELQANRVARLLWERGVRPGSLVAVTIDRSSRMIEAVMGILKAGGAYVPLEPYLPEARMAKIMDSLGIRVVVTREGFLPKITHAAREIPSLELVVCLDVDIVDGVDGGRLQVVDLHAVEDMADVRVKGEVAAASLAYVIFTSGSTGTPKGVMETHRPAVNVIQWVNRMFDVGVGDRLLFIVSLGFDLSVYDIFGVLASGGCVRVASETDIKEPKRLLDVILDEGVTFWDSAPAALQQLSPFFPDVSDRSRDSRLRLVFLSGDWIPVPLPDLLVRSFPGVRVVSLGGATEATIWSNYYPIGDVDPNWPSIPYGKPIQNAKYYILDCDLSVCPIGVAGDLYIGGQCLASGYINDEVLTADKFIPNPFIPGGIMYKTGDVARWFEDGNMEFLGRKDHQVKIRGFRIELGEIEAQLRAMDGVQKGLVIVRKDRNRERYLCAYFVADGPLDGERLRGAMARELPEYMLPAHFVQLTGFPLTANGKVDRGALPEPNNDSAVEYIAPHTDLEQKLAAIWSDVLGKEASSIGIADDFFESGGHSLNAAVVISRMHKALNVKVPLGELFRNPTIQGLATVVESSQKERFSAIQLAEEREYYPLSAAQKRLYILQQMDRQSTVYNLPAMFTLAGDVDVDRIETVFDTLLARHQALRSSFEMAEGQPVQRVRRQAHLSVRREEGDDCRQAASDFIQPFDLAAAPLARAMLFRRKSDDYLLAVDIHHIVADGISMEIIAREFSALYRGLQLPPLRLSYKDYSQWQQSTARREAVRRQEEFWMRVFSGGIPELELPTDFPRPAVRQFDGSSFRFELGETETAALERLGRGRGMTMYMMLLSVYVLVLAKLTDQEDIVVGTPVAGRDHPDLEGVVGMFVNTLALYFKADGSDCVADYLDHIKTTALEAFQNQDVQFEDLVQQLSVKRDTGRNPVFDAMFTMQNQQPRQTIDSTAVKRENSLLMGSFDFDNKTAKFDLNLQVTIAPKRLYFVLEYSATLFKRETAERIGDYFRRLASKITDSPQKSISDIELVTGEEKESLLSHCCDGDLKLPLHMTICRRLAEIAGAFPGNIAVTLEDRRHYSYECLLAQARLVAERLRQSGIGPGAIVALLFKPSFSMIVSMLAVLQAGAAYLPIDPGIPPHRQRFLLRDSNASAVVSDGEQPLPQSDGLALVINDEPLSPPEARLDERDPLIHEAKPEDPAYVIYTSGTTGQPKGVVIEHKNVCALLLHHPFPFRFGAGDVWTMFHSYSFDFSVWEMYGALMFGGRLVMVSHATTRDPRAYGRLLERERVTVLNQTPSAFYSLAAEILNMKPASLALAYVIFGGEALNPPRLKTWRDRYPDVTLVNMYGITETTVHVTYKEIGAEDIAVARSNIGTPLKNLYALLTDRYANLRPAGMPGELCVGGAGVARGYLNRPELTAEKFVPGPFSEDRFVYRSGDLVKSEQNGDLVYLGRRDRQVKIRGYRIETAEVEAGLLQHDDVFDAVVSVRDIGGQPALVAYFIGRDTLSFSQLREFLGRLLPAYMIPAHLVPVKEVYLTPNGKIDRRRLDRIELDSGQKRGQKPQGRTQEIIAAAWRNVLVVEDFDVTDNFFDCGGNSLTLVRVNHLLREELGVDLPVMALFEHPTIRSLADYIDDRLETPPEVTDRSQVVKNARHTRNLQFEKRRKRN